MSADSILVLKRRDWSIENKGSDIQDVKNQVHGGVSGSLVVENSSSVNAGMFGN